MTHFRQAVFVLLSGTVLSSAAHASCGANVCSARTGWGVQSINDRRDTGTLLDLRLEYIDQNDLRTGSHTGGASQHHDELYTLNRNAIFTLDHGFAPNWGVTATLPVFARQHQHIHHHQGAEILDRWDFTRAGDMRVLFRHHRAATGAAADGDADALGATVAFNAGLKLPTGEHEVANAAGDRAERTLQPGTGTTDLLLGGYFGRGFDALGVNAFAQAGLQYAIDERAGYRPGDRWTFDIGASYELTHNLAALAQINLLWARRDRGAEAEPDSTGGEFVFFNPGLSVSLSPKTQAYLLVQVPLYQRVNGTQLTADHAVVVGFGQRF